MRLIVSCGTVFWCFLVSVPDGGVKRVKLGGLNLGTIGGT